MKHPDIKTLIQHLAAESHEIWSQMSVRCSRQRMTQYRNAQAARRAKTSPLPPVVDSPATPPPPPDYEAILPPPVEFVPLLNHIFGIIVIDFVELE